jgi:NTE family protein
MIDTLILSGGGPSGIAYVGILKALEDKKILDKSKLKEIITTSVGIIFSILYLLDYNVLQIEKIILETDLNKIVNTDDLNIDDILVNFGLFDNKVLGDTISSFIRHKLNKNDITLKELYQLIPIKLTVKVYNTNLGKTEYFNYENYPDVKLSLLTMMTTAIPYFFKPVKYNDYLYVDGGLKGNFPIEACKSKDYLGFFVKGGTTNTSNFELFEIIPILEYTINLMNERDNYINKDDKKIFIYDINGGLNFSLDKKERNNIIEKGYNMTIDYLKKL